MRLRRVGQERDLPILMCIYIQRRQEFYSTPKIQRRGFPYTPFPLLLELVPGRLEAHLSDRGNPVAQIRD